MSVFYSPDAMLVTESANEPVYTKSRVCSENNKTVIRFSNKEELSVTSAFGLQLVFEYYCYLTGARACIDRMFIDIGGVLRNSPLCPVYAVVAVPLRDS